MPSNSRTLLRYRCEQVRSYLEYDRHASVLRQSISRLAPGPHRPALDTQAHMDVPWTTPSIGQVQLPTRALLPKTSFKMNYEPGKSIQPTPRSTSGVKSSFSKSDRTARSFRWRSRAGDGRGRGAWPLSCKDMRPNARSSSSAGRHPMTHRQQQKFGRCMTPPSAPSFTLSARAVHL